MDRYKRTILDDLEEHITVCKSDNLEEEVAKMKMPMETKAKLYHQASKIEMLDVKTSLENRISTLINKLQKNLDRLKNDNNYLPNSLGIVQDDSRMIDLLCKEYCKLHEFQQKLYEIIK